MSQYQPFPIWGIRSGLDLGQQPWISPADAFREMHNAIPFRGRIVKRRGYELFSTLGTKATGTLTLSGGTTYTATLATVPILPTEASPSTYAVTVQDSAGSPVVGTADANGTITGAGITSGSVNYATGAVTVTFTAAPTAPVTISYEYRRDTLGASLPDDQNAVMGIHAFTTVDGTEYLLAWDRRRVWLYDTTERRFNELAATLTTAPVTGADVWTGSNAQWFWPCGYRNQLVICNGQDACTYFDGTDVKGFVTAAPFDSALMAFVYRGRLVFLRTEESSAIRWQRLRWSKVDPNFSSGTSQFDANGWSDAPTNDRIVTAGFLGNDLVVFFEQSVFRIAPLDDPRLPFLWEKIGEVEGAFSTPSVQTFPDRVAVMGPTAPVTTNGQDVEKLAEPIPDIVLGWNTERLQYSHALRNDELRHVLWTYPSQGENFPNRALVFQYDDEVFSTFDYPFHAFGIYRNTAAVTWNGLGSAAWDTFTRAWDDPGAQGGFPLILAGDRNEKVWKLSNVASDDGASITLRLATQDLNPYRDQGQRARLGWIDIIAARAPAVSLQVRLYAGFGGSAYLTRTVSLAGSSDKVRVRILANRVADVHRIEIEEVGNQPVAIEAIIPHFAPVAPMRSFT